MAKLVSSVSFFIADDHQLFTKNLFINMFTVVYTTVVAPQPWKNMEASEESIRMTSDPQSKTFLQSPDTLIHLEKSPSAKSGKYSL